MCVATRERNGPRDDHSGCGQVSPSKSIVTKKFKVTEVASPSWSRIGNELRAVTDFSDNRTGPSRILFVDDEQLVLDGLRNSLRKQRRVWDMHFALGGEQALAMMATSEFDVIVSDMRMPGMDGAALLQRTTKEHPTMVRIILSGHAERDAIFRALKVSHQFLAKPCDTELLVSTVERACSVKSLLADESLRAVVCSVEHLPALPAVYTRLTEALNVGKASAMDIGSIISEDPAMSAKLLQVVNSAYFGLPRRITQVGQAVAYLGIDVVRFLVLTFEALSVGETMPRVPGFSLEECQRHSLICASIARKVAPTPALASEASTAAALQDIGLVLLAVGVPQAFARTVRAAHVEREPLYVKEREILGVTHAEVGAYLLALWGLPLSIVEAVAYQHGPGRCAGDARPKLDASALVYVSRALAAEAMGERADFDVGTKIDVEFVKQIGMEAAIDGWASIARSEVSRWESGLNSEGRLLAGGAS
jgi:HD-like signal output (HDOD) protein/CheY-like chemotaxis protein